jgi:fructokinase
MSDGTTTYGAIEAGGTKFVCAVGEGPEDLHATTRIPTTTPYETLRRVVAFFRTQTASIAALGVGTFGPVDLDPDSSTFGHLLHTPKDRWRHVDLVGRLHRALEVPVALETDVNAAALAEDRWGAAQDVDAFLYLTVGTGIGGGFVADGRCLHGRMHPEMGHVSVPRADGDDFEGVCRYHGACLEGLASGPALQGRWGARPEDLPADHPAWPLQAHYLAHACATFTYALSPERIILGGGVMQRGSLFPLIRERLHTVLGGYLNVTRGLRREGYVLPPGLGTRAGILGALALAHEAARRPSGTVAPVLRDA